MRRLMILIIIGCFLIVGCDLRAEQQEPLVVKEGYSEDEIKELKKEMFPKVLKAYAVGGYNELISEWKETFGTTLSYGNAEWNEILDELILEECLASGKTDCNNNSSSSTAFSSSSSNSSSSSSSKAETERIPLATCKYSNPVDCAVKYIKDNYNVSKWALSDDIEAYQNTVTNDYVIYVTIKGENAFGGTVQNTFEVITDEDSKYVYSCIKQ